MGRQLSIPVNTLRTMNFELGIGVHQYLCDRARRYGGTIGDQLYLSVRRMIPDLPDIPKGLPNRTMKTPHGTLVVRVSPPGKAMDMVAEHATFRGLSLNAFLDQCLRSKLRADDAASGRTQTKLDF